MYLHYWHNSPKSIATESAQSISNWLILLGIFGIKAISLHQMHLLTVQSLFGETPDRPQTFPIAIMENHWERAKASPITATKSRV